MGLLIIQSCSSRNDKIFSASDDLHYINLYEAGNEFELLYNGINTATGTYMFKSDTIFLNYTQNQFKEFDPNEKLTRRILIDKASKRVHSIDDKIQFCANIQYNRLANRIDE